MNMTKQANITRDEAVALINKQLIESSKNTPEKGEHWHYGRQEIKELIDYIYGPWKEGDAEIIKEEYHEKYPARKGIDQSLAATK